MTPDPDNTCERNCAPPLSEWFSLQLRFAETLAARGSLSLVDALTFYTNFHRRLAYGNVARGAPDAAFTALAREIAALPDHASRLERLVRASAERPKSSHPHGTLTSGCFACEPPDADGCGRFHFSNRDTTGGVGPLHRSKLAARRGELAALVALIAEQHPRMQTLTGGSWLYNTDAYCRLFPAEYIASRKQSEGMQALHGGSIWGQFLDFRGAVKPRVRDEFLARIGAASFDVSQPWTAFPLPILRVRASLEVFVREYMGAAANAPS